MKISKESMQVIVGLLEESRDFSLSYYTDKEDYITLMAEGEYGLTPEEMERQRALIAEEVRDIPDGQAFVELHSFFQNLPVYYSESEFESALVAVKKIIWL